MMSDILTTLAFLSLAAWLVQLLLRGGFWRAEERLDDSLPAPPHWPTVAAVVPARNETAVVEQSLASLLGQDYPGDFSVVLVDDGSTDGTAERAVAVADALDARGRLTVVRGEPLPAGWTGKMWAVEQGVRQAAAAARYLVLTDADIVHDPHNLRRLVSKAEADKLDLVSLMVLLQCRSFWERLLIPAFVFFFQMLYPFPLVNRLGSHVAAAAGGCMLVRRAALERAGGIAAIRGAIIDDCALARIIKGLSGSSGRGGIWLGLTATVRSVRAYETLGEIWGMVARTAYTQLNYSPLLLLGTIFGMIVTFLAPPLLALLGLPMGVAAAALVAALAWSAKAVAYWPTLKLYNRSRLESLFLPLAGVLYLAMTVDSALRHWQGQGGAWKGRTYSRDSQPSA